MPETVRELQGRLDNQRDRQRLEHAVLREWIVSGKTPEETATKIQEYFNEQRQCLIALMKLATLPKESPNA